MNIMSSSVSDWELVTSGQIICGLYQLDKLLDETSTSKLYSVVDDNGYKFAAKITKSDEDGRSLRSYLAEFRVFSVLTDGKIKVDYILNVATPHGFPNVFFVGKHCCKYDVIVMEFLSPDLYSIRNDVDLCASRTKKGYLMLAEDMLLAVMVLHQHGFVHQNVKPHNFRLTNGFSPYLLDFSMAKRYINPITNKHCPPGRVQHFIGSLNYASLGAHRLMVQSRKDDLISLGYSIIDIMKRGLPWDREFSRFYSAQEIANYVVRVKENISLVDLCSGLPNCILLYMQTVTTMSYDATPKYDRLRAMIKLESAHSS